MDFKQFLIFHGGKIDDVIVQMASFKSVSNIVRGAQEDVSVAKAESVLLRPEVELEVEFLKQQGRAKNLEISL